MERSEKSLRILVAVAALATYALSFFLPAWDGSRAKINGAELSLELLTRPLGLIVWAPNLLLWWAIYEVGCGNAGTARKCVSPAVFWLAVFGLLDAILKLGNTGCVMGTHRALCAGYWGWIGSMVIVAAGSLRIPEPSPETTSAYPVRSSAEKQYNRRRLPLTGSPETIRRGRNAQ